MKLAILVLLSGCGSGMWLITPRPEVTYYEVTVTSRVAVTSEPRASVFVDGAEAGETPRSIAVPHKELRRQRRQSIIFPLLGTLIDVVGFSILTAIAADQADEAAPLVAGLGLGTVVLDAYLITGRSVVNEGVEILPGVTEIGVRAPGFQDAARKIRVPDITSLHFPLIPTPSNAVVPWPPTPSNAPMPWPVEPPPQPAASPQPTSNPPAPTNPAALPLPF